MFNKIKKGYKVVKLLFGRFVSCFSPCETTYRRGEYVTKRESSGGLGVFTNINCARIFIQENGASLYEYYIFKCKYIRAKRKDMQFKCVINGVVRRFGYPVPIGTDFAEKVKLTKLVERVEPKW